MDKLAKIPTALETVERLKELYEPHPGESSTQIYLRISATLKALKEFNSRIKKHGLAIEPKELLQLFNQMNRKSEKENTSPSEYKSEPATTIEMPNQLKEWSTEPGSSFQSRNHADALKFKVPDKFKIVESEKLKTGGMIHYSSPAFGPDGLMAVGSNDKQIHFYKYNPQTHKIEFLAKRKLGGWVSSSPAFGPEGTVVVGSEDSNLYIYQIVPDDSKTSGKSRSP
ncbi:MAG: hypothetical protein ACKOA8_04335 [Deltaproteobacteria bacterium]